MNGRNASGNTPLHVCAVNNQVRTSIYFKFKFILNSSFFDEDMTDTTR